MVLLFLLVFFFGIFSGIALGWFLARFSGKKEKDSIDKGIAKGMENLFGRLSQEALNKNQSSFFNLAENKFNSLLKTSEESLGSHFKTMGTQLKYLGDNTIFLKGQLENSQKQISSLGQETTKLNRILSNSQERGAWGERAAEDIISIIGLVEGKSYERQKQQEGEDGKKIRPDYTFFLPGKLKVNMDVKFPLKNYNSFLEAKNELQKEESKKGFIKDIRSHIKQIGDKEYVDPKNGTINYALIFIPHESMYAFINVEDKGLIDYSLDRKIILCSPMTLYAVLSLIRQSVSAFKIEKKAAEIQRVVLAFKKEWGKFVDKMNGVGKSLENASNDFRELESTRIKKLEKPMDQIESFQTPESKDTLSHQKDLLMKSDH